MSRSWQDLPRFSMFLIKVYQVSVHLVLLVSLSFKVNFGVVQKRHPSHFICRNCPEGFNKFKVFEEVLYEM